VAKDFSRIFRFQISPGLVFSTRPLPPAHLQPKASIPGLKSTVGKETGPVKPELVGLAIAAATLAVAIFQVVLMLRKRP